MRSALPRASVERLMPVEPDVPSTMVPPEAKVPSRSASSMICLPTRSLEEPLGLQYSSLACYNTRKGKYHSQGLVPPCDGRTYQHSTASNG